MGMYTDLNARIRIKEEFWPVIIMLRDPATDNGWNDVAAAFPQYPFLATWAEVERCDDIPYNRSSQQWKADDMTWSHKFKDGVWVFQCSLKNYEGEIKFFVATVLARIVDKRLELYSRYEENEMVEQLFIPGADVAFGRPLIEADIARQAHSGQFRRDDVTPYITHPAAVALALHDAGETIETIQAGWLHDVLEDTAVTAAELSAQGVPWRVIDAVKVLTRSKNQSYEDYLKGVASDPVARLVKLADIRHNMSDAPTDKQVVKYTKALAYLAPLPPPTVLWLSLPDAPELQDAHLLATLSKGDAWTADIHQAARIAGMGYAVKRCDRHVAGHLVETTIDAAELETSIERGIEMRGVQELNRNLTLHDSIKMENENEANDLDKQRTPSHREERLVQLSDAYWMPWFDAFLELTALHGIATSDDADLWWDDFGAGKTPQESMDGFLASDEGQKFLNPLPNVKVKRGDREHQPDTNKNDNGH